MMGHREKLKGGNEYDALTKARKRYKYLEKPGVSHWVKKHFSRRVRKEAKHDARVLP